MDSGFFGRILSVRGEFGYWVFEGPEPPAQRPSWNYRAEDGGGILADMLPHWRYVLDDLFGAVRTVYTLGVTHIPERVDEERAQLRGHLPRTPPTRASSSRAGSWPSSTRPGACA